MRRDVSALCALFRLNLRARRTLVAVGTDNRAHDEPKDETDEHGRRERVERVRPEFLRHESSLTSGEPAKPR